MPSCARPDAAVPCDNLLCWDAPLPDHVCPETLYESTRTFATDRWNPVLENPWQWRAYRALTCVQWPLPASTDTLMAFEARWPHIFAPAIERRDYFGNTTYSCKPVFDDFTRVFPPLLTIPNAWIGLAFERAEHLFVATIDTKTLVRQAAQARAKLLSATHVWYRHTLLGEHVAGGRTEHSGLVDELTGAAMVDAYDQAQLVYAAPTRQDVADKLLIRWFRVRVPGGSLPRTRGGSPRQRPLRRGIYRFVWELVWE